MKWRMADAVERFEPWRLIVGRKAVSLEEYDLGKPLGRAAALPETLVLECAVEFGRWLVMASSDFVECALLEAVADWRVRGPAGRGCRLWIKLRGETAVTGAESGTLALAAEIADDDGKAIADGRLTIRRVPLAGLADTGRMRLLWKELFRN